MRTPCAPSPPSPPSRQALVQEVARLEQIVVDARNEAMQVPPGNAFFALFK